MTPRVYLAVFGVFCSDTFRHDWGYISDKLGLSVNPMLALHGTDRRE
jgi:hypothetical protein